MADTGFPDATNTGVPAGVDLTLYNGNLVINTPGAVIDGLDIQGYVYINAPDVTLQNCKVTSNDFNVVQIATGITGAVVQNCEINGVGTGNDGDNGIGGQGTFIANNIYNIENGINLDGDNSLIQDNYIHDLLASGSPHYDAIQIDGSVSNATISHNTIINSHDQTSAVMIDNYFGPISNITVDNNLLVGGGYTIYVDAQFNSSPITGVAITNNHMGSGQWGITNFNGTSPVYTGNVNDGWDILQTLDLCVVAADMSGTPAIPVIASFATDSGVIGDGMTNDHTLTLSGPAEPNSTVKLYDGTALLGTAAADGSGALSYTTGTLSDTTHSFTATDTDAAGNVSAASTVLAVTVTMPGVEAWKVLAMQDFNSDGTADLLWTEPSTGAQALWTMNGTTVTGGAALPNPGPSWHVKDAADFNGDGKADILWQNDDGTPAIWTMNGTTVTGEAVLPNPGPSWHVEGVADFNGDGKANILWQNDDGTPAIWTMNGTTVTGAAVLPNPGPSWHVEGVADFNGDGKANILWQNDDGTPAIWTMNGTTVTGGAVLPTPSSDWHLT
jgi:Bacterial Ig-like domain/FG-GAP-like repeat